MTRHWERMLLVVACALCARHGGILATFCQPGIRIGSPVHVSPHTSPRGLHGTDAFRRREILGLAGAAAGGEAAAAAVAGAQSAETGGFQSIGYRAASVDVGGESVPVAVWYPVSLETSASSSVASEPYGYRISVAKIFKMILGVGLPAFLASDFPLASQCPTSLDAARVSTAGLPLVVFAHGYLGSRFDMLHLAESLARRGFVVAAPEFAESLSASFEPSAGTTRHAIMLATLRKVERDFATGKVGLIGHSAGGGTAVSLPGRYELGRVVVAGGGLGYPGPDPLLVILSEGDFFCRRRWGDIQAAAGAATRVFEDAGGAEAISSLPAAELGERCALLFNRNGEAATLPCHISFLDPRSNDAMVRFLSPLLPLARLLGVPVLDFDVYQETRDAEATASMVLPPIVRFFETRV